MTPRIAFSSVAVALAALSAFACTKDDQKNLIAKVVDAAADGSAAPAGPKNLDLAKAALAAAKAKVERREVLDADCPPLQSLESDFADSKDPEALKTTREIDAFCGIDVTLEGTLATLKTDNAKLEAARKRKDRATEKIYVAIVKDNCGRIREQLEALAAKHLDREPKVATLKAEVDPICAPVAAMNR